MSAIRMANPELFHRGELVGLLLLISSCFRGYVRWQTVASCWIKYVSVHIKMAS